MPVSRPARASSKKLFRFFTRSVTAKQADQNGGCVAAESVDEADARAADLARARLAARLGHDLAHLRRAGGSDRMAFGLEPARWVYRQLAAEAGPALPGGDGPDTGLEEPQALRGDDLGDGETVVQLDDVDIGWRLARVGVGAERGALGGGHAREVGLLLDEHRVGDRGAREHPDRAPMAARHVLRREDDGDRKSVV